MAVGAAEPNREEPPAPELEAYLSDAPILLGDDDPFAHHDLAAALGSTLRETAPPFTVGLFGDWGSGKSSVLLDVPSHLGDQCAFVTFDAWRYDGDTLRRNFLRELALSLAKDEKLTNRHGRAYDPDRELRDLDVDVQTTGRVRLTAPGAHLIQALWAALVFGALAFVALQVDSVHDALFGDNKTRAAPITAAVAIVSFAASYLVRLVQATPETVSRRRVEDPERFSALYVELLKRLTVSRLVVAIDNLDRCSPDRAVEVLSTIKTYLEPARAQTGKDVVFLIAVDVDALRRHLLAQEREERDDAEGAQRYVDEYLRKFFNAHLRIDAPRPDDMVRYVAAELDKVRLGEKLTKKERERLVQVLATGLRHNPRRVKQFLNNLELRLRLIRQREDVRPDGPPAIVEAISDRLLVIAKLAVIEEEHHDAYRAIVRRPLVLREWDARAVIRPLDETTTPSGVPPPAGPEDSSLDGERGAALLAFLRVTADIKVPNPRPFLRYKQSNEEREVPNYWELREAAISGAREQLESLLGDDQDPSAFARALPRVFSEELEAGNVAGARSAVDVLLSVPGLQGAPEQNGELLTEALRNPVFNQELRRLPPAALLQAARELNDDDLLGRAADGVIDGLIDPDAPSRLEWAQAIAVNLTAIPTPQRNRLTKELEQPTLANDLGSLSALLGADAGLLTPALLNILVTRFQSGTDGVRSIVRDGRLRNVLKAALAAGTSSDLPGQLAGALPAGISPQTGADPAENAAVLAGIRELAEAALAADPSSVDALVTNLSSVFGALPGDQAPLFADWLFGLSDGAGDGARNAAVASTVSQALSEGGIGLSWVERNLSRLRTLAPATLADQLQAAAFARPADRQKLIRLALDADPAPTPVDRAQTIAQQLASAGDIASLRWLLELPDVELDAGRTALAQTLSGGWPSQPTEAQVATIGLIRGWLGGPDHAGVLAALLTLLGQALGSEDAAVARSAVATAVSLRAVQAPQGVQVVGFTSAVDTLVQGAIERAEQAVPGASAASAVLDALIEQSPLLSPADRERVQLAHERLEGLA